MTVKRKRFIKINTGFKCEQCGFQVTPHPAGSCRNHCPVCLYSKHLDGTIPGDRLNVCGGLMVPVEVVTQGDKVIIVHRCNSCGWKRKNKSAPDDNEAVLIELVKQSLRA